jgi:Tol biopolymer transport system component
LPHIAIVGFELDRPATEALPPANAGAAASREAAPAAQVIRSLIAVPDTTPAPLTQSSIAVSPDGRRLAFAYPDANGQSMLWIRTLGSLDAQPLAGTEGAQMPFWSPDGRYLAFRATGSRGDSQLKRVDVAGGSVITLVDGGGAPGDWSPDGTILFPYKGAIHRVPADGGKPIAVPGKTQYSPSFLPDGKHYLHTNGRKVYLGSLDSAAHPVLIEDAGNALYADRHIFFVRETTLYAQPFDPERLSLSGSPVVVAERIRVNTGNGAGTFSVSAGGVLAYVTNRTTTSRLTWFDRGGREVGTVGEPGVFWNVHLSRDGRWAVGCLGPSEDARTVWLYDVNRGIRSRVTRDDADDTDPALSPDGSLVAFSSRRGPLKGLDVKAVAGSAAAERLTEDGYNKYPQDWSPDGKYLVYSRFAGAGTTFFDLMTIDLKGDQTPRPLVQTSASELQAAISPDGKWVAYTSNESGRIEVHVTGFPAGGPGRQVTSSGGTNPHWSPDGRELFFLNRSTLMRAAVTASTSGLDVGVPSPLFDLTSRLGDLSGQLPAPSNMFSVAPDGQRFLFAVPQRLIPDVITIVVNWQVALRDRGGVAR